MSIERTSSFKTSDEQVFHELGEAKAHEIALLVASSVEGKVSCDEKGEPCFSSTTLEYAERVGKAIVENTLDVMDILSTTERSISKARAINGGTKPRKTEEPVVDCNTGNRCAIA